MAILKASNLEKVYGQGDTAVHALKSTNLEIEKGEFVAIIGPSGSGKSTLLHLLAGLDKPSSGNVYIEGKSIHSMKEAQIAVFRRQKIGFVFQFFNLLPIMSMEENIVLPILLDENKVDWEYAEQLMDTLGIKNRRRHLPGALSGGQQQRAAIARALCTKPSIIFADEPTGNLDTKSSHEVMELFTETIKKYNQTLVLITHNPEIAAYADRILKIEDGMITEDRVIRV